jgi:hypothetical protein
MGIRDGNSSKTYATAVVDGDRSKASASATIATKADVSGDVLSDDGSNLLT